MCLLFVYVGPGINCFRVSLLLLLLLLLLMRACISDTSRVKQYGG